MAGSTNANSIFHQSVLSSLNYIGRSFKLLIERVRCGDYYHTRWWSMPCVNDAESSFFALNEGSTWKMVILPAMVCGNNGFCTTLIAYNFDCSAGTAVTTAEKRRDIRHVPIATEEWKKKIYSHDDDKWLPYHETLRVKYWKTISPGGQHIVTAIEQNTVRLRNAKWKCGQFNQRQNQIKKKEYNRTFVAYVKKVNILRPQ